MSPRACFVFIQSIPFLLASLACGQHRNVLLIIADDMGVDSHGLYNGAPGATLPPTPNIDALKTSGVQFLNAYAHATCSPTRASILTGRAPWQHGVTTAVTATSGQLMAGEFTLPRAFQAVPSPDYALAHFGKWHLTLGAFMENDPANAGGWPHYAGSLNGGLTGGNGGTGTYTAWTKTINGVTGAENSTTTYATTDTTNDALAWIQSQGSQPWFAWVAYNAPHSPFHKPPNDLHTYDTTVPNWNTLPINTNLKTHFHAAIEAMDTEIGRLLAGIDLSNTWVVFIGDNGTPPQTIQTPYTNDHAKNTLYEGGMRVPLLIRGPGVISPDRVESQPVHATDLYATILDMAGIDFTSIQPVEKPVESISLMPILLNESVSPRIVSSSSSGGNLTAQQSGTTARSGDFKYIRFGDNTESLFNIADDPNEQVNLLLNTLNQSASHAYALLVSDVDGQFAPPNLLGAPVETQWQKFNGAEYARIYRTQTRALNGISDTTWAPEGPVRNGRQDVPAYAGLESVRICANWVYAKGSGLPHYTMGPWYFDSQKTQLFVNYPNQWDMLIRIPRRPQPATVRTNTNFGPTAVWVNTAIIHNQLDAFYWNGTEDVDDNAAGTEYWTRNARLAEGPTFDPAGAHQPFTGESHHHISPFALRYELGDHMDYNPSTHTYSEASGTPSHSPILGWSFDGYPIYGPYGYNTANDPNNGIRRMVSGFVPRDGNFGTTNLNTEGRTSLPAWAIRSGHGNSPVADATTGPTVSTAFPIGWYLQDFDYLGEHGYTQGTHFDLDECNGRWCVTPEYPQGIYAYFVTIDASFQPAYPYIIGRQYYGVKQGGNYAAASTVGFNGVDAPHVTTYTGGANSVTRIDSIGKSGGNVVLRWDSAEGGNYLVESSADLTDWTTIPQVPVHGTAFQTESTLPAAGPERSFHRVRFDGVDAYDVIDTP